MSLTSFCKIILSVQVVKRLSVLPLNKKFFIVKTCIKIMQVPIFAIANYRYYRPIERNLHRLTTLIAGLYSTLVVTVRLLNITPFGLSRDI